MIVLTVDMAVFCQQEEQAPSVLLIKRRDGLWALPGGKVGVKETVEQARDRELREETSLTLPSEWQLAGVFSDPHRDPRGRYVSITYRFLLPAPVQAIAGSDAQAVDWFSVDDLPPLAFDHTAILEQAMNWHWYDCADVTAGCPNKVRIDGDLCPSCLAFYGCTEPCEA